MSNLDSVIPHNDDSKESRKDLEKDDAKDNSRSVSSPDEESLFLPMSKHVSVSDSDSDNNSERQDKFDDNNQEERK